MAIQSGRSDDQRGDSAGQRRSDRPWGDAPMVLGILAAVAALAIWLGSTTQTPRGPVPQAPTGGRPAGSPQAGGVQAAELLPSWNDGPVKRAILDFVERVTREGGDGFVPVPERVAVFDHDGTLVCEKPIVHGMFLIDRVRALAVRRPAVAHEEPFTSLLSGDIDFVRRLGKRYFMDLTFRTLEGVPEERIEAQVREFLATARHPVFDVPFSEVTYQPMKELIAVLRERNFTVWICTGSGEHFMRPAAEAWYRVGPEHVIASRAVTELREVDEEGRPAAEGVGRLELVVLPQLEVLNDEERKPVSIGERIGRRPILAVGNVGTTGDIEMLRWSQTSRQPNLQLLVHHDDAEREMAYGEPGNESLTAAGEHGWQVVSMATDWNRIFAKPLEKSRKPADGTRDTAEPSPGGPALPEAQTSVPAAAVVSRTEALSPEPAGNAPAPASPTTAAEPPRGTAAPAVSSETPAPPSRWEKEIVRYETADREQPPEAGGVLFLGSSNIRMWTTLAEDFAGFNPINRGLGGALLSELVPVTGRVVAAARPSVVVVSAGTNDIHSGATPEEVRDAFMGLVAALERDAAAAKIVFLAIAPSISRWEERDRQQAANGLVKEFIASRASADLVYLDAGDAFLGPDGLPAVECFLDDRLHPSTIGNARRAAALRPVLEGLRAKSGAGRSDKAPEPAARP